MFDATSKKLLLAVLVACFLLQTGLVYSDDVDVHLTAEAVEGRRLFHRHACQVCHQLWGQGGFLGPDLTNAASRVDQARLASLLTEGSGQMPAYGFTAAEVSSMRAFLAEIDRPDIGRGQLRMGDPAAGPTPQIAFETSVLQAEPPESVQAGFETFRGGICTTCHVPFQVSAVGAPDLSLAVERWDDEALHQVLRDGRPMFGMPPPAPALSQTQREEMVAYLHWLNANRDALLASTRALQGKRTVNWRALPWWEYR